MRTYNPSHPVGGKEDYASDEGDLSDHLSDFAVFSADGVIPGISKIERLAGLKNAVEK